VETLYGTIKLSKFRRHDFTQPNDPTFHQWTNFSLEDFALYWDLPNFRDASYCYFQEVDFSDLDPGKSDIFPIRFSVKETIVEDGKEKGLRLDRNYKGLYMGCTSLAAFFSYLLYLAC
jgi:hypothetical protein